MCTHHRCDVEVSRPRNQILSKIEKVASFKRLNPKSRKKTDPPSVRQRPESKIFQKPRQWCTSEDIINTSSNGGELPSITGVGNLKMFKLTWIGCRYTLKNHHFLLNLGWNFDGCPPTNPRSSPHNIIVRSAFSLFLKVFVWTFSLCIPIPWKEVYCVFFINLSFFLFILNNKNII